jgi:hypothetical protein
VLTHARLDAREVRVQRSDSGAVVDDDGLSPAVLHPREGDGPGSRSPDSCAERCEEIEPGVEAVAARPEAVTDRCVERGAEVDRRSRTRHAQQGEGAWPGGTIRRQSGPRLESTQRCVGMGAEVSVQRAGGEAMPGERKLERRHVPPLPAGPKDTRSQWRRTAVGTQEGPRPRVGNTVHGKPRSALKTADCTAGSRTEHTIGRARVDALLAESDLEGGRFRIAHLGCLPHRHRARIPRGCSQCHDECGPDGDQSSIHPLDGTTAM